MTELENDIYIQLLNLYINDLEAELFLNSIQKRLDEAVKDHLNQQPHPQKLWPGFNPNVVPIQSTKNCSACGLRIDGPMGYVCPNAQCPCGLGNVFID